MKNSWVWRTRIGSAAAGQSELSQHHELFHQIKCAHRDGQWLAPALGEMVSVATQKMWNEGSLLNSLYVGPQLNHLSAWTNLYKPLENLGVDNLYF